MNVFCQFCLNYMADYNKEYVTNNDNARTLFWNYFLICLIFLFLFLNVHFRAVHILADGGQFWTLSEKTLCNIYPLSNMPIVLSIQHLPPTPIDCAHLEIQAARKLRKIFFHNVPSVNIQTKLLSIISFNVPNYMT